MNKGLTVQKHICEYLCENSNKNIVLSNAYILFLCDIRDHLIDILVFILKVTAYTGGPNTSTVLNTYLGFASIGVGQSQTQTVSTIRFQPPLVYRSVDVFTDLKGSIGKKLG